MFRARIFVVLIALAALAPPAGSFRAAAQGAVNTEALQVATELMAIMSKDTMSQMVSGLTGQLWPQVEQAIRSKRADIDQKTLSELRAEFERIQMQYMGTAMGDAPQIYARHFTAQELRDMLAFYRTPTGQKSLQVLPQLMTELFATVTPRMQMLQIQILEAFTRVLRQRGIDL